MEDANTGEKYVDDSDTTYEKEITYYPAPKSYTTSAEDVAVSQHFNEDGSDQRNHGEEQEKSYPLRELKKPEY